MEETMDKPLKIILEGCDKSGKSTLAELCRKEFPDIEFADRSFISDRVYAYLFDRDTYLGVDITTYLSYWEQVHKNNLDTRIILCEADIDDLVQRSIAASEPFCRNRTPEQVAQYLDKHKQEFHFWTMHVTETRKFPRMRLNTSKYSIEQCMERIREFIK